MHNLMYKVIHTRLYKSYYPISTIAELEHFVKTEGIKIDWLLRIQKKFILVDIHDKQKKYMRRLKKPSSVGRLLHNQNVIQDMQSDYSIIEKEERLCILAEIRERFLNNEITIEDANTLIYFAECERKKDLLRIMLAVVALILVYKFYTL